MDEAIFAVFGWPEVGLPPGAWLSADGTGTPFALAAFGGGPGDEGGTIATNERRTIRAVLAGAIYNRRELRATLAGRHTVGASDADVAIHVYEERGVQCVKAFRGAFALVLWDSRRQRMLIARDQLGLRSLYYATERQRLVVASDAAMLGSLPALRAGPDAAVLDTYVALGTVPAPATLYPGVRQLRPGELGVWEDGRLRTQQYWQLNLPERRMTRGDLGALFRVQIGEALRMRQTGGVAGMLLSGGVASAAVLGLAAADNRAPARAYTVDLPGDGRADVSAAATLASRAGVEHVVVDEPDWPTAVDALLAAHGGPVGGPETPLLAAAADAAGPDLAYLLAGIGAEEIFGGAAPARYADRLRRFRELPGLAREGFELWSRFAPRQWTGELRRLIADERLGPLEMYARSVSVLQPEMRAELYSPEALEAMGESQPWAPVAEAFADAVSAGAIETADTLHFVEVALTLPARAEAANAAIRGTELRLPLADHRLAQFVASVPPAERGTADERQLLLRGALDGLVPHSVLARPHAALVPAPVAWRSGSLRDLVEDTLSPARLTAQNFFRADTVGRLLEEHLARRQDNGRLLWAILLTSRWLERRTTRAAPRVRASA